MQPLHELDSLSSVFGFAEYFHVGFGRYEGMKALAYDGVVVSEQYGYFFHG